MCPETKESGLSSAKLNNLLQPLVEDLGYEFVGLEHRSNPKNPVLIVYIDHPDGISVDDCETVSREIAALLDVEDPIPGHYNLEVSSPGLDRKLTKPDHFQRFMGEEVKVKLRFPLDGRRNFRGVLTSADTKAIAVEVDGVLHELPTATIESARLVPSL